MTENAHTPGPWKFRQATEKLYACLMAGGRLLAIFRELVSDADGRLIAAAPDLLEALKALVEEQVDYMLINNLGDPEQKHNIRLSRAAIARATGAPSHD